MTTNSTFPHRVPYATDAQSVKFAPVQDSETGDDMLEPPFVRVRDGNTAYMYVDTSPETQITGGTNSAQWNVGASNDPSIPSHLDARKIKRQALVALNYLWTTPNVNPTNQTFVFRTIYYPLVDITAQLPTYNYLRMFTARGATDIDTEDGIIDHLATVMTNAMIAYDVAHLNIIPPLTHFNSVPSDGYRDLALSTFGNTNCIFFRMSLSIPGATFRFTGGTAFTRGRSLYGLPSITDTADFGNLATYRNVFAGGPVSFIYTRWFDVTSRVLTQNAKLPLSGTDIPPNMLVRIYIGKADQESGITFVRIDNSPQWLNWIRSQAINSVDIQVRDEFGELIEIPQRQNNISWFSLIFLNQL